MDESNFEARLRDLTRFLVPVGFATWSRGMIARFPTRAKRARLILHYARMAERVASNSRATPVN